MPFIGRDRELVEIEELLRGAVSRRTSLVLVSGEPGIGKTFLCRTASERAADHGVRVLWGRCWEGGGAPSYAPWRQILRRVGRESCLTAASVTADAVSERFAVFDAVAAALRDEATASPLMLVLDDLHAADLATALLLRYVATYVDDVSMLIVGTHRDAELKDNEELDAALADVTRSAHRLSLAGFDREDVARLLDSAGVSDDVADAVHVVTGGNPFFVDEVGRLLASSPELGVPASVRAVLRERRAALSHDAAEVLAAASVLGVEFNTTTVQAVTGLDPVRVLTALDSAERRSLVAPASIGYRFIHALIREAVYADLSTPRRAALHLASGRYLAESGASPAEVAFHTFAARELAPDEAVEWTRRAGDDARRSLAFEVAADYYARAATLLESAGRVAEAVDLLLLQGQAESDAGNLDRSRVSFARARSASGAAGRADAFATAVLGEVGFPSWLQVATAIPMLGEALEGLGDIDSALRARLMARLAYARCIAAASNPSLAGSLADRLELSQAALNMARRVADIEATHMALQSRHWARWTPDGLDERIAIASEMATLGRDNHRPDLVLLSLTWIASDYLEAGDVVAADAAVREVVALAASSKQPFWLCQADHLETMQTMLRAPLDVAEERTEQNLRLGNELGWEDAVVLYWIRLLLLRREQGRLAELEETVRAVGFGASLAVLLAELGRVEEARSELARVLDDDAELNAPMNGLLTRSMLADVCIGVGDVEAATRLYDLLLPYHEGAVTAGIAAACLGPVSLWLGRLATFLGDWDGADAHLVAAHQWTLGAGAPRIRAQVEDSQTALAHARADRPSADAPAPPAVDIRILGPLEVTRDGTAIALRGTRRRMLVALLAEAAGAAVAVDRLTDALWGERPPANSTGAVQSIVSELRTAVGDAGFIVHDPPGYRLGASVTVDAQRLADAVSAGRDGEALSLWRGPAFGEFADEPWAKASARHLENLRHRAVTAGIERRLRSGRASDVVGELESLVALDPLDEPLRALLMTALYRSGRQADALRTYADLRAALRDELGIDPSPALRDLEVSILQQAAELDAD